MTTQSDISRFTETYDAWDTHVISCDICLPSRGRDEPFEKMCVSGKILFNEWVPWHNRVFNNDYYKKVET